MDNFGQSTIIIITIMQWTWSLFMLNSSFYKQISIFRTT